MFKIGDRVRITRDGRVGTVAGRAPSDGLWVDVDGAGRVRLSPIDVTLVIRY